MVPTPDLKIGILTGPTASGKTQLALELAQTHPEIEIVNADSLLVYREMDIGTAKPTVDERRHIPHHLIDLCSPSEAFTAGDFVRAAWQAIDQIESKGKRPLIVGGTGFYLKALIYGLWSGAPTDLKLREKLEKHTSQELYVSLQKSDSESALRIGPADRYRLIRAHELIALSGKTPSQLQAELPSEPNPRLELWIVDRVNSEIHDRIAKRTRQMVSNGLIDEVTRLRERYPNARALKAVGYAQVSDYLDGKAPEGRKVQEGTEGLIQEIELATRQLVKKQRTWFRGQKTAKWFTLEQDRSKLLEELKRVYP